jgi:hypothetical protein
VSHAPGASSSIARWLAGVELPLWLLAAAAGVPFAFQFARVAPPWPRGSTLLASALSVAGALVAARWRLHARESRKTRVLWTLAVASIASGSAYLAMHSRYTFTIPTTGEVGVKGFACTSQALLVFGPDCPGDELEALKSINYESPAIWKAWSITAVRLGLFGSWIVALLSVVVMLAWLGHTPFSLLVERAPPSADGTGEFFFVSYAHDDLARVIPVLDALAARGHRFWFDKGIPGGTAWDEVLSARLRASRGIIAFLSQRSQGSRWFRREILLADELDKPIYLVGLERCELTPPLDIVLSRLQVIAGNPEAIVAAFERAMPQPVVQQA